MAERKMKYLYMVEGDKWTKVGLAFENADGTYDLELAAIPTNGKLKMCDAPNKQGHSHVIADIDLANVKPVRA